jgi:hypothetical protein
MCFFHVKIYFTYPHILPYIRMPVWPLNPLIPPLYPPYTPLYPSPMSTPPPPLRIPPPIPPQLSNISEFRNGRKTPDIVLVDIRWRLDLLVVAAVGIREE